MFEASFNFVNFIFALLGIFVAIQSIKNRKELIFEGRRSKARESDTRYTIEEHRKKYSRDFRESEIGSELIDTEFDVIQGDYNQDHQIQFYHKHDNQEVIKLSKTDVLSSSIIEYLFVLLITFGVPILIVAGLSYFFEENIFILISFSLLLVVIFILLPFGIYKSEDVTPRIVFSFFDFGNVIQIECEIRKIDFHFYDFTYIYFFKVFGKKFCFAKSYKNRSMKEGIIECYKQMNFCNLEASNPKYIITSIGMNNGFSLAMADFRFGWMRMVVILTNYILYIPNLFKRPRNN